VTGRLADAAGDAFASSRARFATVLDWLDGVEAGALTHAELEDRLDAEGRGLLCQLLQDHLDLRAQRETRVAVVDADGMTHGAVEAGHARRLATVFGEVDVTRLAYRRRGHPNLHPADAALNLPAEKHSHGLRRLGALEAARGSFDTAVAAIERATGQALGKRQVEQLAARAAVDFDDFYARRPRPVARPDDVLVLSCDGKGIVMRPDALRAATAKAAAAGSTKLTTRLSKGEKRNRKRMATVAAVYDITPVPRTPTDVLTSSDAHTQTTPPPSAANKWLTASVADDAASVVAAMFDEADRRDPDHTRTWIALVDGNNHQIARINTEARNRGVTLTIVIDFVHVVEYLWKAAWSFYDEGDPTAEAWVRDKALAVLAGQATRVAAAIRRKATYHNLAPARRAKRRRRRQIPGQQGALPRLRRRPSQRMAHRHRRHRRRLPPPHQGPHGHHRRPLERRRRRSRPQATCTDHQRRLRRLLAHAPDPRTTNASTSHATPHTPSLRPPDVPRREPHRNDLTDRPANASPPALAGPDGPAHPVGVLPCSTWLKRASVR
jgi:hypothetical protein